MTFYNVDQNTDEWLDMRSAKVTGSAVKHIMANYGKAFGEPAKKLAKEIATERLKGSRISGERYTNKHMEAGHIEEPIARSLYEKKTGYRVANGGFFDNGKTGCSPDGCIVFENAGIEIKSVTPAVHFDTDKRRTFDPAYKWQLMFNLKETGWDFIDYVSFCDQYIIEKRLLIVKVFSNESQEYFRMIDDRINQFEELVESNIKIMQTPW